MTAQRKQWVFSGVAGVVSGVGIGWLAALAWGPWVIGGVAGVLVFYAGVTVIGPAVKELRGA